MKAEGEHEGCLQVYEWSEQVGFVNCLEYPEDNIVFNEAETEPNDIGATFLKYVLRSGRVSMVFEPHHMSSLKLKWKRHNIM